MKNEASYGRLHVIGSSHRGRRIYLECRCECGTEKSVRIDHLKSGKTLSCGCLHSELSSARTPALHRANTTHGKTKSAAQTAWFGMRQRCYNPKSKFFHHYGGRGIRISAEWPDFASFYRDMGDPPPGMTIERIANDGPYAPWNCRWATRREQMNNRRVNRMLTVAGRTMNVSQWSRETGVHPNTITQRIDAGRAPEDCVYAGNFSTDPPAWIGPRPKKTHCKYGHLLDEANTYNHGKQRVCRACKLRRVKQARILKGPSTKIRSGIRKNSRLLTLGDRTMGVIQWSREPGIHPNTITARIDAGRPPEECLSKERVYRRVQNS